ncbi:hypothetical protein, partial [Rhodoplanes sp. SY1]|uniref:hypothetical protein n=1 Tax=Rhodoplanes sp. SY1 TaxID=3166646 RepID=UPI0038B50C1E
DGGSYLFKGHVGDHSDLFGLEPGEVDGEHIRFWHCKVLSPRGDGNAVVHSARGAALDRPVVGKFREHVFQVSESDRLVWTSDRPRDIENEGQSAGLTLRPDRSSECHRIGLDISERCSQRIRVVCRDEGQSLPKEQPGADHSQRSFFDVLSFEDLFVAAEDHGQVRTIVEGEKLADALGAEVLRLVDDQ